MPAPVRWELCVWDGIAPLIWRNLRMGWAPDAVAVDVSPWGLGACQATLGVAAAAHLGRHNER